MKDLSCWLLAVFTSGLLTLLLLLAIAGEFGPTDRRYPAHFYPDTIVRSEPGHDHGLGYWQRRAERGR